MYELESEIQSLNPEIELLLIENDSLKIQKEKSKAIMRKHNHQHKDIVIYLKIFKLNHKRNKRWYRKSFINSSTRTTSIKKEALRQLLVQTQSQLSGAQAESQHLV